MLKSVRTIGLALVTAAALTTGANAECVNKAGQGTNNTVDGAKFQAWEAVLQATSWPMWSQFMAGSQKVGDAPGYKVSGLKSSCKAGGIGHECVIQARLCK